MAGTNFRHPDRAAFTDMVERRHLHDVGEARASSAARAISPGSSSTSGPATRIAIASTSRSPSARRCRRPDARIEAALNDVHKTVVYAIGASSRDSLGQTAPPTRGPASSLWPPAGRSAALCPRAVPHLAQTPETALLGDGRPRPCVRQLPMDALIAPSHHGIANTMDSPAMSSTIFSAATDVPVITQPWPSGASRYPCVA
jgi:hypothetical protein